MHSQVQYPVSLSTHSLGSRVQKNSSSQTYDDQLFHARSLDSDIAVRRKAAFLLNSLLLQSAPVATTRAPGTRIRGGPAQPGAIVHPNSHASMVADPSSTDTAPETLRAVRAHGLLPVIIRELTEPTPYGPDGDEGDGGDADLEEKLMRCVLLIQSIVMYPLQINASIFAGCCIRMCRLMMGRSMVRRITLSERSWTLGGPRQARASWDLGRTSCGKLRMPSHR
jgi:hypothetical protein